MIRWKRDVICGVAIALACIVLYIDSLTIPVGTMKNIKAAQPGTYVRMWTIILFLLSLIMIVQTLRKKSQEVTPVIFHKPAVITIALIAVYVGSMDYVGFIVSTLVFCILCIIIYSYFAGKLSDENGDLFKGKRLVKSIVIYIVIAIITTISTYVVFAHLLNVKLPGWNL